MTHTKTELEFAAKQVNDVLAKSFPDKKLTFMSFVFDEESIGYVSTNKRIDALRSIMEWLSHNIATLSKADFVEMLELLKNEDWDE